MLFLSRIAARLQRQSQRVCQSSLSVQFVSPRKVCQHFTTLHHVTSYAREKTIGSNFVESFDDVQKKYEGNRINSENGSSLFSPLPENDKRASGVALECGFPQATEAARIASDRPISSPIAGYAESHIVDSAPNLWHFRLSATVVRRHWQSRCENIANKASETTDLAITGKTCVPTLAILNKALESIWWPCGFPKCPMPFLQSILQQDNRLSLQKNLTDSNPREGSTPKKRLKQ